MHDIPGVARRPRVGALCRVVARQCVCTCYLVRECGSIACDRTCILLDKGAGIDSRHMHYSSRCIDPNDIVVFVGNFVVLCGSNVYRITSSCVDGMYFEPLTD